MSDKIINDKFELIDCPVCEKNSHKPYFSVPYGDLKQKSSLDYSSLGVCRETVLYVKKCRWCDFIFVNPRVKPEFASLIYNESKKNMYINNPSLKEPWTAEYKAKNRVSTINSFRQLLAILNRQNGNCNLKFLDYGTGFGKSMSLAEHFGIESYGIDVDRERLGACEKMNLKVSTPEKFDAKYPGIKVDMILMQNCIEHLIDLPAAMSFIAEHSNTGALVWINGLLPRIISIEKKKKKFVNAHFIEHVNYFSIKTLDYMFFKYGFKPVNTIFSSSTARIVTNFNDLKSLIIDILIPLRIRTYTETTFNRIYEYNA